MKHTVVYVLSCLSVGLGNGCAQTSPEDNFEKEVLALAVSGSDPRPKFPALEATCTKLCDSGWQRCDDIKITLGDLFLQWGALEKSRAFLPGDHASAIELKRVILLLDYAKGELGPNDLSKSSEWGWLQQSLGDARRELLDRNRIFEIWKGDGRRVTVCLSIALLADGQAASARGLAEAAMKLILSENELPNVQAAMVAAEQLPETDLVYVAVLLNVYGRAVSENSTPTSEATRAMNDSAELRRRLVARDAPRSKALLDMLWGVVEHR